MNQNSFQKARKFLNKCNHFFVEDMDKKVRKAALCYFIFISGLEVLAYSYGGIFSVFASRIWLLSGIICFSVIFYDFLRDLISDAMQKEFISIGGILILLIFFISFIGNLGYADVNPDATQQIAAGVNSYEVQDWNFTGQAFLGYPNRQYLIAALPALLFGRSIATLHLGFALPFLVGVIAMYSGLRQWFQYNNINKVYALIPVYALLGFRFVSEYFLNFEQAITPLALTMIIIGIFLKTLIKPNFLKILMLSWVATYCAGAYTPVLATLGLFLLFLALYVVYLIRHKEAFFVKIQQPVESALVICFAMISTILITIIILINTNPTQAAQTRDEVSFISYCFECIRDFLFDKYAVFLGGFGIIVIIYLGLSLTLRLKLHDFLIAGWVLAVIVLSNYMVGYTSYENAWILQRAMIVIPVLITAITIAVVPAVQKLQSCKKPSILLVLLLFLLAGNYNFNQKHQSFLYFGYIQPMKYMLEATNELLISKELKVTDKFNLILYTNNPLQTNPQNYAEFLYPNAHTYVVEAESVPEEVNWSLPTIIVSEETKIENLYQEEMGVHTYHIPRYDMNGQWYTMFVSSKME